MIYLEEEKLIVGKIYKCITYLPEHLPLKYIGNGWFRFFNARQRYFSDLPFVMGFDHVRYVVHEVSIKESLISRLYNHFFVLLWKIL